MSEVAACVHRRSRRLLSLSSPRNRAPFSGEVPASFGWASSRVVHDAVGRFSDVANLLGGGPAKHWPVWPFYAYRVIVAVFMASGLFVLANVNKVAALLQR